MIYTVLLTSVGGGLGPVNIRCFQNCTRHDVRVVGVDARKDAAGRFFADDFATVPAGTDADFVPCVRALIEEHRVDLVLPCSDEEALALAAAKGEIESTGARLATVDIDLLQVMVDKAASFEMLQSHGIAVPDWTLVRTADAIEDAIEEMLRRHDGEICVKPMTSRGSRDTFVIRRDIDGVEDPNEGRELYCDLTTFRREFKPKLPDLLPLMVMECLIEPVHDIDVLTWKGKLLRAAPRLRLNPGGVPFRGGVVQAKPALLDLAENVASATGMSWLYDYDIMSGRDGKPRVIELNPRPSGSIAAAIAAGVPFYDDLISLALGEELPPVSLPDEVTIMPYTDVVVLR